MNNFQNLPMSSSALSLLSSVTTPSTTTTTTPLTISNKILQLFLSFYTWKTLRYAVNPDPNTSQTMLTFWTSAIPSEFPLHISLLHLLLLMKGYYSDIPRILRNSPSSSTSSINIVSRSLDTVSFCLAISSLIPLYRMLRNQLTSHLVYADNLRNNGIIPVQSNRSLSVIKYLSCLFPIPRWLNRNIRIIEGITYGMAPAEVTIAEALKDAASNFTHNVINIVSGDTHHDTSTSASSSSSASHLRKLKLDIYVHKSRQVKPKAPIFAYIHGGGWVVGDKQFHSIPLLMEIARNGWLVITINYRLAGAGNLPPYPYALYDCKRAIAWIRENAHTYGGDSSFIIVSGESAGGHLSLMMGLTPNISSLQKEGNIQHINTQVDGVVDLYGVTDWTDSENQWSKKGNKVKKFLEKLVVKRKYIDHTHEFIRGSPLCWLYGINLPQFLKQQGIYVRRPEEISWIPTSSSSTATNNNEEITIASNGPNEAQLTHTNPSVIDTNPNTISPLIADMCIDRPVPPIMIVHGDVDTLVPIEESRIFYKALKQRRERESSLYKSYPKDIFIEVPGAHHAYNFMMSPRTLALSNAVVDWLNHVYTITMAQRNERSKL